MTNRRPRQGQCRKTTAIGTVPQGLTLIEVLVALFITTLALSAGFRASGALLSDMERQREQLLAQLCLDNHWVELQLSQPFSTQVSRNLKCQQGGQSFDLRLTVSPAGSPILKRFDVQVRDSAGRPVLSQWMYLKPT